MYLIRSVEHRYDMAGSEMQLYKVLIGRFIAGVVFYLESVERYLLAFQGLSVDIIDILHTSMNQIERNV